METAKLLDIVLKQGHSPVRNYIIPGLTSVLIGGQPTDRGCVRAFIASRTTKEFVTPHSHRFAFTALVLRGYVINTIYRRTPNPDKGDLWAKSTIMRVNSQSNFSEYRINTPSEVMPYEETASRYETGETYSMEAAQIHDIWFSKDAVVLMFEGKKEYDHTFILQPVSAKNNELIPTFRTEPWMFLRGEL